jgi:hypothetical protein
MALALACTCLFFPQTLNSVVLGGTINNCFKPGLAHLQLQDQVLNSLSSDYERWTALTSQVYSLRERQIAGVSDVGGKIKLLELEIGHRRMGPSDVAKVFEMSQELGIRAYMLEALRLATAQRRVLDGSADYPCPGRC